MRTGPLSNESQSPEWRSVYFYESHPLHSQDSSLGAWRVGAEKFIKDDPSQLKLDFEGMKILPKSNAGSSLLAYLLVSKYQDHLPFYRQIEIFKRSNIHLAASTINGWFVRSPWAEKTTSSVRTTKPHNIRSSFTPFWVPVK